VVGVPELISGPTRIPVPGGKVIDTLSVAHMTAPGGWTEPFQAPEFDEYTLVLRGRVRVEHDGGALLVSAGQAVLTRAGERIRYATPDGDGAEYVAICLPAFGPDLAHREDEG
jgi:quercetin dioxygenase-like cupin family protein